MHNGAKRLLAGLGCLMVACWSSAQAQENSIELVGLNVAGAAISCRASMARTTSFRPRVTLPSGAKKA